MKSEKAPKVTDETHIPTLTTYEWREFDWEKETGRNDGREGGVNHVRGVDGRPASESRRKWHIALGLSVIDLPFFDLQAFHVKNRMVHSLCISARSLTGPRRRARPRFKRSCSVPLPSKHFVAPSSVICRDDEGFFPKMHGYFSKRTSSLSS